MPKARLAGVYRQYDSYFMEASEIPLRILIVREYVTMPLQSIMALGNHRLCCNPPGWAWRIGWGHPKPGDADYDQHSPELLRHSLGHGLWSFSSWLSGYGYKKEKRIFSTVISEEDVLQHFPEWRSDIEEDRAYKAGKQAGENS